MFFNINVCSIGFLIFPDLKQYQTTLFQKGTNEGKTMTVNPLCQSSQNSKRKKGKNKKKEKKMKNKKKHLTELKRHKKLKYSQKNRGSKAKQSKKRGWATKIWKVLVFKRGYSSYGKTTLSWTEFNEFPSNFIAIYCFKNTMHPTSQLEQTFLDRFQTINLKCSWYVLFVWLNMYFVIFHFHDHKYVFVTFNCLNKMGWVGGGVQCTMGGLSMFWTSFALFLI